MPKPAANEIISLFNSKKQRELATCLTPLRERDFKNLMEHGIHNTRFQLILLVKAIFYGSPNDTEEGQKRRQFTYEAAFAVLEHGLPTQMGTDLIGILLLYMDELSADCLAKLAMKTYEMLKYASRSCGRFLELLPKLLSILCTKDEVPYKDGSINGEEFKKHFIGDLCSIKWIPENATQLATVFKDIPLSFTELQFVVDKLIRLLKVMEMSEIPSFIFQLLILSGKTKGLNQVVLQGIVGVFNSSPEEPSVEYDELMEARPSKDEFQRIEGTTVLHITYAMKQEPELCKEFLKFLKSNFRDILSPFTIALGLAVSRLQAFQTPIFDCFKSAILKNFKEIELRKNSAWFRDMLPKESDIPSVLMHVVKNSARGYDYITQELIEFGFVLMEANGSKAVGRKGTDAFTSDANSSKNPIANLGFEILLNVFRGSDIVRKTILEQTLNRIFNKGVTANQCINLLAQAVKTSPHYVLDSVTDVQRTINCLPMMPPTIAYNLIRATFPLLRINMPLKESMMLVLRKSLSSGQLTARKIAVFGYLHFLQNFKILGHLPSSQSSQSSWSSQISAEVHSSTNPEMNEVLCLELLRSLTISLSQQAEVRQIVYSGLSTILFKNKKMTLPVLELLKSRIEFYYQTNKNIQPPFKLEKTILIQNEKTTLLEPLALMLQCALKCIRLTNEYLNTSNDEIENANKMQTEVASLEEIMTSLVDRMIIAELEDFELDKSADYNTATSVGMKNNLLAVTVLKTYEVLIEHLLCGDDKSTEISEKVLTLFKNYKQLMGVLKNDSVKKTDGKAAGRPTSFKPPACMFSIESLEIMLFKLLHKDDINYSCLQESEEFLKYLVSSAAQKIQELKGENIEVEDEKYSAICQIARSVFTYYNDNDATTSSPDKGKKNQSLHSICLETFLGATLFVFSKSNDKLREFVYILCGDRRSRTSQSQNENILVKLLTRIETFQQCVDKLVNQTDDSYQFKDLIHLFNIIASFSTSIITDETSLNNVFVWIQSIATEKTLNDSNFVKTLMQLFLSLLQQSKNKNVVLRDLAQDIHSRLGDIDEDVEVEISNYFAIVTEQTASSVKQLLLQHFEQILTEVDWTLNVSKASLTGLTTIDYVDGGDIATEQEKHDKKICNHLGSYYTAMHELVQTALPPGVAIDNLLKVLVHGYNSLNLFVKYYIAMYTLKVGKCCSRFEKLIKLVGTMLSPQVYALITYIQVMQNDESVKENKKRKLDLTVKKTKVLRDTRQIPPLIYAIEQFETSLMELSKKSKINLMQHVKLSTSRDFRINLAAVKNFEPNQSENEDEDDEAGNPAAIADPVDVEPPAKKTKLSRGRKAATK